MTFPRTWLDGELFNGVAATDLETRIAQAIFGIIGTGTSILDGSGQVWSSELPLIASSHGQLFGIREASTPLPASGSAQSSPYDTQDPGTVGADGIALFSAMIVTDQTGTLAVQSSPDGVTWTEEVSVSTSAVGSTQVARFSGILSQRYVQAIETNGATPQTTNLFVTMTTLIEVA